MKIKICILLNFILKNWLMIQNIYEVSNYRISWHTRLIIEKMKKKSILWKVEF